MHIARHKRGMTLIEVLVSMGIILIITTAIITFFSDTFSFNRTITDRLTATGDARRALKVMISEVRIASPSSLGAYPLAQVATSSFIFYGNIDADADKERIRYYRNGTALMRGVVDPTGSPLVYDVNTEVETQIAQNVVNDKWTPIFSYFDSTYTGSEAPLSGGFNTSAVRLVRFELVIDVTGTSTATSDRFTSQVSMRNLKDNL